MKSCFSRCVSVLLFSLAASMSLGVELQEIPMNRVSSGAFYVPVQLDGADQSVGTDMLLDTGSGYVSLSRQTFSRLGKSSEYQLSRYIQGVMADGKVRRVPIYQVTALRLSESCVLHDVEVAVFADGSRDILGLNALQQIQPFTMQLDPPVLKASCS